jgi:hypothetical protein
VQPSSVLKGMGPGKKESGRLLVRTSWSTVAPGGLRMAVQCQLRACLEKHRVRGPSRTLARCRKRLSRPPLVHAEG